MTDVDPAAPRGKRGRPHLRPEPGAPSEPWNWRSAAAALALAAGLASVTFGSLVNVAAWLSGRAGCGPLLLKLGTLLLVVSIPLLAAGAHCLDLEDARAVRHARGVSAGAQRRGGVRR